MFFLLSIFLQRTIFFSKTNFTKPRENPSKGSKYVLVGSLLAFCTSIKLEIKKTFFSFKTDILGRKPSSPTKEYLDIFKLPYQSVNDQKTAFQKILTESVKK